MRMNLTYWRRIPRFVRWVLTDAVFVSIAAAMYGSLFGIFEASILHDSGRVIMAMGRFALGGCVAGALLGSLGALTEPHEWLPYSAVPQRPDV